MCCCCDDGCSILVELFVEIQIIKIIIIIYKTLVGICDDIAAAIVVVGDVKDNVVVKIANNNK